MNFLSIDCSTDIGSLFLKIESKTFSKILQSDKSNNNLLMQQIIDFFKENNLRLEDISEIFINRGPGNFSSLRGSLATAKGISLSKNINLYAYDTFLWLCANFFNQKETICSIIKFKEKYFIKIFDKNLKGITYKEEKRKDEIITKYDNKFKVIPKKLAKYFDEKILNLNNLNIINLDHKELKFLKLKGLLDKNLIKPLYLS